MMENSNSESNVIIKYIYLSRSASLKKAQRNYRERNREKMSEIQKRHYDKIKDNEEFKKKQRERKREYYQRKKLEKLERENKFIESDLQI